MFCTVAGSEKARSLLALMVRLSSGLAPAGRVQVVEVPRS